MLSLSGIINLCTLSNYLIYQLLPLVTISRKIAKENLHLSHLAVELVLIIYTVMTDTRNSLIAIGAQVISLVIYAAFEVKNRRQTR